MIEEYLMESESLGGTIVLIDSLVGPTELDLQMVEWLDHIDLPYRFVATKSDKVRSAKSSKRRQELTSKLGVEKSDVLWVSAESGDGISQLRSEIVNYFESDA
jgi:GTP-binding protein